MKGTNHPLAQVGRRSHWRPPIDPENLDRVAIENMPRPFEVDGIPARPAGPGPAPAGPVPLSAGPIPLDLGGLIDESKSE